MVVAASGLIQFWAHRNDMNPDGISYIEMAEASLQTGWHALVNGYWSPLYPFLISIILQIFHPQPQWQFTVVHGLNFVIYLVSFACFEVFLREIFRATPTAGTAKSDSSAVGPGTLWLWSCVLFLWASQYWLTLAVVSPDLCIAALLYLATAILLRILRGRAGWLTFVAFGAVLGVAYLAKAVMFPLTFVFLGCAFLLLVKGGVSLTQSVSRVLAALAVFAVFCAPLILLLSQSKGRLTFGDSGKIAYAEYVDKATLNVHWQGEPGDAGIPLHPTRKISSAPPLYEFAQPVAGSYPPWYDPSYWYDGVNPHFSLKGQLWALFRAANAYLRLFSRSGALYAVALAFLFLMKRVGSWSPAPQAMRFVLVPSIAALLLYALVLVEFRYVAPFALVLLVWIFSRLRISQGAETKSQKTASAVIFAAPLLAMLWPLSNDMAVVAKPRPFESWNVARALRDMGISNGTRAGFVGRANQAYWAHLAGVHIVAEIPEQGVSAFLHADPNMQDQVVEEFKKTGASVVVMKTAEKDLSMNGWQRILGTPYYVFQLNDGNLKK